LANQWIEADKQIVCCNLVNIQEFNGLTKILIIGIKKIKLISYFDILRVIPYIILHNLSSSGIFHINQWIQTIQPISLINRKNLLFFGNGFKIVGNYEMSLTKGGSALK
jgi:hypothetical protein